MKQKTIITFILGAGLGLSAASAVADTSTFVFSNPTVSGTNGSLDVASQLSAGSTATFTSGVLEFSFSALAGSSYYKSSSSSGYSYVSSNTYIGGYNAYSYSYSCGLFDLFTCYGTNYYPYYYTDRRYQSTVTAYYGTPPQGASVTVGATTADANAPATTTSTYDHQSTWYSWNGSGWNYYTDYYYKNLTTIGGSFLISMGLDSFALDDLNSTGFLGFDLSTIGNITLDQVSFTGDYNLTAIQPPVTVPVPEPETYAMLLAGLGLLSFTARRRKQSA